jgi:hypothetical protein
LEQRTGVDLLSAPKITTLSGRQAQVSVQDSVSVVANVPRCEGRRLNGLLGSPKSN